MGQIGNWALPFRLFVGILVAVSISPFFFDLAVQISFRHLSPAAATDAVNSVFTSESKLVFLSSSSFVLGFAALHFAFFLHTHHQIHRLSQSITRKISMLINEAYCEDFDIGNIHYCVMGWPYTNFYGSTQSYLVGCYGLLMVGVGLMSFPTCPQEALLLQKDIVEAKEYLKQKGVDLTGQGLDDREDLDEQENH
ncbi:Dolichol-phosphate mannose synthase subunit 3, partial [Mucuna pruriens]